MWTVGVISTKLDKTFMSVQVLSIPQSQEFKTQHKISPWWGGGGGGGRTYLAATDMRRIDVSTHINRLSCVHVIISINMKYWCK